MRNQETVAIVDVDVYRTNAQYHRDIDMLDSWLTLLKSALAEQGVSWPDSEGVVQRMIQKLSEAQLEHDRHRRAAENEWNECNRMRTT